jgi:hypothetical protein
MNLQYTLTFKEFAEGIKPNPKTTPASKKNKAIRMTAALLAGGVVGTLMDVNVFANRRHFSALIPAPEFPTQNLWTTLAPGLALAGFILFATVIQNIQNWRMARAAMAAGNSPVDQPASIVLGSANGRGIPQI